MIITLIKKQLLELFQSYFIDRKTGKVRSKKTLVFYVGLFAFLFVSLGFAFYSMAAGLGSAILGHGFNWLYFALMGLLSIALGLFGSVFNTYSSLYLPKDNEFLLSMPIPSRTLVLARTGGVYIMSLMYSAWIWIPVMIAYWVFVPANVFNVIFPILLTFVIAAFVSVLSCILGWIVALIVSKAKGKSFLTVFLSLFVIVAYYFIYFKIINSLSEIVNHLDSLGSIVRSWLHYVYLLGKAADGDALSLLLVFLITAVLFGACLFVLSKTFTKIALTAEKGEKTTKKAIGYEKRSVRKALLNREFKRFTSMSMWMLNGGLGLLIMMIAAIALIFKSGTVNQILSETAPMFGDILNVLPVFIVALLALIVSTNTILSCSVSLEGKALWILQVLPVDTWEYLYAKEKMGALLNLFPTLFSVIVFGIVLQVGFVKTLLMLCALCLFIWLKQDFDLFLNLRHPDFSWTNPTNVIKQGFPVMISLFGSWGFCALIALGGFYLHKLAGIYVTLISMSVLFGVILFLLRRWLKTKGTALLEQM